MLLARRSPRATYADPAPLATNQKVGDSNPSGRAKFTHSDILPTRQWGVFVSLFRGRIAVLAADASDRKAVPIFTHPLPWALLGADATHYPYWPAQIVSLS